MIKKPQCFPHYRVAPWRGGATSSHNFIGVDFIHKLSRHRIYMHLFLPRQDKRQGETLPHWTFAVLAGTWKIHCVNTYLDLFRLCIQFQI